MKKYEKIAIAVGVGALGLAAYQAYKTKQSVDAVEATDPSRNPITAAVDLSKSTVGSFFSWFRQGFDESTGRVKGKASEVVNKITAIPSGVSYYLNKAKDYGLGATQAGTKYLWSNVSKKAADGKKQLAALTNKPFTLMGAAASSLNKSRIIPKTGKGISDMLTGIGSGTEKLAKKTYQTGRRVTGLFDKAKNVFGSKLKSWGLGSVKNRKRGR